MRRVGFFGGSFDPVHVGHLLAARAAFEELGLERVFFVPAGRSPFKLGGCVLDGGWRVRLLRLALAGVPEFEVFEGELGRGGVSFTVDTARFFLRRFVGVELFCLVGSDQVGLLPRWREAEVLAGLVVFAVVPRPGSEGGVGVAPGGFRCRWLRGFSVGVSSSLVRARARAGLVLEPFVPGVVGEVVRGCGLYGWGGSGGG